LVAGKLSVVSILLSNGKSNRCFNIFLALHCRQSIRCFNSFLKWKISQLFKQYYDLWLQAIYPSFQFFFQKGNKTVVLTIFRPCIGSNLSVLLILLSTGKSHRCFNNFCPSIAGHLAVLSILLSNGKSRCFNNFLSFDCRQSLCCFNCFVKWKL